MNSDIELKLVQQEILLRRHRYSRHAIEQMSKVITTYEPHPM